MATRAGYRWFRGGWTPSAAERRVLDELALGHTNAEIAVRLGLSPETVKSHISRMLDETGCANRGALAQWWREQPDRLDRPALLMPLLRLLGRAARVGAGVAALGLGLLLLVAGINGVPRLVDRLEGGPRIIGVVRPPEPSPNPASPSPAALPSSPPGVPLPVQFLWEADGDDERLQGVRALAVDAEGNAYVQDAFHHQIVKFDPDGRVLTRWGREGDGPGQFNFLRANGTQGYPGAIAVAPDGTIYVADDNGRIQQFDPDGHYLGEWANKRGGPGRLEYAGSMTFDQQGHIWMNGGVAGSFIQKFGRDGTLLASWGDSGTGPDEWNQPGAFALPEPSSLPRSAYCRIAFDYRR